MVVGAGTTHREVGDNADLAAAVPALGLATPYIGHFQIRNRGTIGGSLAHADPAAEYPAVALALDATFQLVSATGQRTVAAVDFFDGIWQTAIGADELLQSVSFPTAADTTGHGVAEFARRHGDFALAGAVASIDLDATVIRRAAIAVFGVASTPLRLSELESHLVGSSSSDVTPRAIESDARQLLANVVHDDPQIPGPYRSRVAAAMVDDAIQQALRSADRVG